MIISPLIVSAAKIAAVAYAGFCVFVYARQAAYLYYPDRFIAMTPAAAGLRFDDLRLKTKDGETIAAWFVPAEQGSAAPTLLFCHGNAGDIGDRVDAVKTFHDLGLNVLIFSYRGYGTSTGTPSEQGTYADAMAAWTYAAAERSIAPEKIVLYGHSLGGAVAAWLATQVKPGALVLESTFTSVPAMARRVFPLLLQIKPLMRFKYDTLNALRQVACPVLIAHGSADELIPCDMGQRLFAAAHEPKRFVEIVGGHNDGGMEADPEYRRAFSEFLADAIPSR
jgi:fermentation-respiration switch protein FrsA (DUF1100 family)